MFESQYNEEMAQEVNRLEAKARAVAAGHPEWYNACMFCGTRLELDDGNSCAGCKKQC